MSSYIFPGYPAFLATALVELGLPGSAEGARRIVPLTDLANLCAQAADSDQIHVPGILAKAAEFRDQLALALRAADLMLADVEAGRSRPAVGNRIEVESPAMPATLSEVRRARKGLINLRESS